MLGWLKKYLWCSWRHRRMTLPMNCYPWQAETPARCYPQDNRYWHCAKCHPCFEELLEAGLTDLTETF